MTEGLETPIPVAGWVAVYPTAGMRGLYPTREACMKITAKGYDTAAAPDEHGNYASTVVDQTAIRAAYVREYAPPDSTVRWAEENEFDDDYFEYIRMDVRMNLDMLSWDEVARVTYEYERRYNAQVIKIDSLKRRNRFAAVIASASFALLAITILAVTGV